MNYYQTLDGQPLPFPVEETTDAEDCLMLTTPMDNVIMAAVVWAKQHGIPHNAYGVEGVAPL